MPDKIITYQLLRRSDFKNKYIKSKLNNKLYARVTPPSKLKAIHICGENVKNILAKNPTKGP